MLVNYFELNKDDIKVIENIKDLESPKILVLNKIDLDKKKRKLPKILSKILSEDIVNLYDEIIPISSKKFIENIIELKNIIREISCQKKIQKAIIKILLSNKPERVFCSRIY